MGLWAAAICLSLWLGQNGICTRHILHILSAITMCVRGMGMCLLEPSDLNTHTHLARIFIGYILFAVYSWEILMIGCTAHIDCDSFKGRHSLKKISILSRYFFAILWNAFCPRNFTSTEFFQRVATLRRTVVLDVAPTISSTENQPRFSTKNIGWTSSGVFDWILTAPSGFKRQMAKNHLNPVEAHVHR